MYFMGFSPEQIVKAVDYFNIHHQTDWDPFDVIEEIGQFAPLRVIEVIKFWKSKRFDMPGEIKIAQAEGIWGGNRK